MKNLLVLCLSLFFISILGAQSTKELFCKNGLTVGGFHYNQFGGYAVHSFKYLNDTTLCNETLSKWIHTENHELVYLSFIGEKVYVKKGYDPCQAGQLLYDFGLNVNDTFTSIYGAKLVVSEKGYKTLKNNELRRYLKFSTNNKTEWIEGIGDVNAGIFYYYQDFEGFYKFLCCKDNAFDYWPIIDVNSCDSINCLVPLNDVAILQDKNKVTFVNRTKYNDEDYWDFGDGTFSNERAPTKSYLKPGCYVVKYISKVACRTTGYATKLEVNVCIDPRWSNVQFNDSSLFLTNQFISKDQGWVLAENRIYHTNNGGKSWEEQFYPKPKLPVQKILMDIEMVDSLLGFIACGHYNLTTEESLILLTNDGGKTWVPKNEGNVFLFNCTRSKSGAFFCSGQGELFFSEDLGETWNIRKLPMARSLLYLQVLSNDTLIGFTNQKELVLSPNLGIDWEIKRKVDRGAVVDGHFFNSKDGFVIFGNMENNLAYTKDQCETLEFLNVEKPINSIRFSDTNHGIMIGDRGLVSHTFDGGKTWVRENCGNSVNLKSLSVIDGETSFASGLKTIVKYNPTTDPPCDFSSSDHLLKQEEFSIYPNPAETEIIVNGPAEISTIKIFDSNGRVVKCNYGQKSCEVGSLKVGFYIVKVESHLVTTTFKLIKI